MTRQKHVKTEYDKQRAAFREASPRHVVTFEADIGEDMKRSVFARADLIRKIGNHIAGELNKRIEQLERTKDYRRLKLDYRMHAERMASLDPESERYALLEKERKATGSRMSAIQKEYGVTFADARRIAASAPGSDMAGSIFVLARCEDIWAACEKVLYGSGRRLHFRKRGDLPAIRAKQPERGIVIKTDAEGGLCFAVSGIGAFGVTIPEKDIFLREEHDGIAAYLADPSMEAGAVMHFADTGELIPVFRPCYAALKCERIRGKLRVYVQVTVAADALPKKRADGTPRHTYGTGRVGCDNGAQSFAAVSENEVVLENLAERHRGSTKRSQKKERILQRRIDRSIRAANPERFEPDGTPKHIRGPYKKSKHCRRMSFLLKEQRRRDKASRKYAVRTDANRIRAMGDELVIEPSNASALQKRAKGPVKKTGSTVTIKKKDGTVKTVQKHARKKRFGRSIQYRCPAAFQTALKQKFGSGYHEVHRMFRASQYDHVLDDHVKKKLSERWHKLPDGTKIQRDIYSAFLLFCAGNDYSSPDRELCIKQFDRFLESHDREIQSIIDNRYLICNSGITV